MAYARVRDSCRGKEPPTKLAALSGEVWFAIDFENLAMLFGCTSSSRSRVSAKQIFNLIDRGILSCHLHAGRSYAHHHICAR